MANLGSLLKSEITRLSRKAVRDETGNLQSTLSALRKQVVGLKREVAELQKQQKRLQRSSAPKAESKAPPEKIRFQARGLKSLRARLGLSAEDFGKLVDVSGQSIYGWEAGSTTPRPAQVQAIASIRSIGKKEALARLESKGTRKKAK